MSQNPYQAWLISLFDNLLSDTIMVSSDANLGIEQQGRFFCNNRLWAAYMFSPKKELAIQVAHFNSVQINLEEIRIM